jgi:hypothetical protein
LGRRRVCRFGGEDQADDDEQDLELEDRWDDPDWVRRLMGRLDAEVEAEEDPDDPYMRWLKGDRQHRINDWGATFARTGVNLSSDVTSCRSWSLRSRYQPHSVRTKTFPQAWAGPPLAFKVMP